MDQPFYWVPYKLQEPARPFIVVGPFQAHGKAMFARESMLCAATPKEYVGSVIIASSEDKALRCAERLYADYMQGRPTTGGTIPSDR